MTVRMRVTDGAGGFLWSTSATIGPAGEAVLRVPYSVEPRPEMSPVAASDAVSAGRAVRAELVIGGRPQALDIQESEVRLGLRVVTVR
ncbi:MAG: hypothetical protein R3F49_12150 [Planctomycetota bacterium]